MALPKQQLKRRWQQLSRPQAHEGGGIGQGGFRGTTQRLEQLQVQLGFVQGRVAAAQGHQPVAAEPVLPAAAGTNADGNPSLLGEAGEDWVGENVDDGRRRVGPQGGHLGSLGQL